MRPRSSTRLRAAPPLCSRLATPRPFAAALALLAVALALPVHGAVADEPLVPTVATSGAADASYSSVVVYGYVDPHGLATEYAFQYGTTTAYGGQTPLAPAGEKTSTLKVSQTITGLQSDTAYHYRIMAVNGAGVTYGADRTFHTLKMPLSLQIAAAPNPVTYGEPFSVEGTLSGTGAADRQVVLESSLFPYRAGFQLIGSPELTSSTGSFSFSYPGLRANAQLRVSTLGATIVVSPILLEDVAVRVVFHAALARRRGYMRLYGTVAPAEVGATVGFQLLTPTGSINEGGTGVKAGTATVSRFERIVRVRHPGSYRALVEVSDQGHVYGYSAPVYVR